MNHSVVIDDIRNAKVLFTRFDAIGIRVNIDASHMKKQNPFRLDCWRLILDPNPESLYISTYGMNVSSSEIISCFIKSITARGIPVDDRSKIQKTLAQIEKWK